MNDSGAQSSSPRTDDRTSTWPRLAGIAVVAVFFGLMIPLWTPWPMGYESIDDGWRSVVHGLASSSVQWGVDLVYTTGPLGFLRSRVYHPDTFPFVIAWGLAIACALLAGFHLLFRDARPKLWWMALATIALFPVLNGSLLETFLGPLLLMVLCHRTLLADRLRPRLEEVYLTVIVSLGGWVLFPHLLTAAATMGLVALSDALRFRRPSPVALLWLTGALGSWMLLGQALGNLPVFLALSMEITSGYRHAMAEGIPGPEFALVGSVALVVLACAVLLLRRLPTGVPRACRALFVIGFSGLGFVALSSALVSQQWLRLCAPSLLLVTAALCLSRLLDPRAPASKRPTGALSNRRLLVAAGLIGLTVATSSIFVRPSVEQAKNFVTSYPERVRSRFRGIERTFDGQEPYRRRNERAQARAREAYPLPALDGTVDYYGNRQGVLIAHGMIDRYTPRPVFQSFVAYTPRLAAENGRFYRSDSPPPDVVAEPLAPRGFPRLLCDSHVQIELARRYRPIDRNETGLILERGGSTRGLERRLVYEGEYTLGQALSIDRWSREAPLWVVLEVEPTLLGRVAMGLAKVPYLDLHFEFASGHGRTHRYPVALGRIGFVLSPLVVNSADLERFVDDPTHPGLDGNRVERITLRRGRLDSWFWTDRGHVRLESLEFSSLDRVQPFAPRGFATTRFAHHETCPHEICPTRHAP